MNLIPAPFMKDAWVPRPAAASMTTFAGFTSPAQINALIQVGNIAYGMIAETSGIYNGKDVPYAYNVKTAAFQTITIPGGAASLPATPASSGDWVPPHMEVVGSRIVITHPGYAGGAAPFFGWLDLSGLSSNTVTGNTHGTKTLDTLSTNVLAAGWAPGDTITSSAGDIPANTTIVLIAVGGLSVTLSNAATGTNSGATLTVSGGAKTAPLYGSGNTNGVALLAVPVSVGQFNGRAYYAVPGNGIQFSDPLAACQITNATQQLIPGNGVDVTAFGGLPVAQTTGGILQALIVFQGDSEMQQITGDSALSPSTLMMNELGVGVGTLAPNTICKTLMGLAFIAPDGLRIINFAATVSEPLGANGNGMCVPFLNAINPSRMCAAFNQNTLRVTVKNGAWVNQPTQEYWLDMGLKTWSGPHSFPAALIVPYQGTPDQGFTMVAFGVNAELWSSSSTPKNTDTYTENSIPLSWSFQTVLLPDSDSMSENKMVLTTLSASVGNQQNVTAEVIDESGAVLDTVTIMGPAGADTVWGSFTWGAANWGGPGSYLYQHPLNWHFPLIFKQASVLVNGNSALNTIIGNVNMQIETLGYLTQAAG